jgi:hypothetical protein
MFGWNELYFSSAEETCISAPNAKAYLANPVYSYVSTAPYSGPNAPYYAALGYLDCVYLYSTTRANIIIGTAVPVITCPDPAVNPAVKYAFNTDTRMCERTVPDATCPIDPLPELPAGDNCTNSLEKGAGKDVDKACPDLTPEMQKQAQCLADKINKLALTPAYNGSSATIRTEAYQKHFVDIWKWHKDIVKQQKYWTAAQQQVCAPTVAKVEAELAKHGIDAPPSNKGSKAPHVLGNALDIPRGVRDALMAKVTNTTFLLPVNCTVFCMEIPVYIGDVQDYVNSTLVNPPACNLRWGGRFTPYDPVHFQLP